MAQVRNRDELAKIRAYDEAIGRPRAGIANGVYPNIKKTLQDYDDLGFLLQKPENSDLAEIHQAVIGGGVLEQVSQLRKHMQAIVDIVESIERAAPNTFGIQLEDIDDA